MRIRVPDNVLNYAVDGGFLAGTQQANGVIHELKVLRRNSQKWAKGRPRAYTYVGRRILDVEATRREGTLRPFVTILECGGTRGLVLWWSSTMTVASQTHPLGHMVGGLRSGVVMFCANTEGTQVVRMTAIGWLSSRWKIKSRIPLMGYHPDWAYWVGQVERYFQSQEIIRTVDRPDRMTLKQKLDWLMVVRVLIARDGMRAREPLRTSLGGYGLMVERLEGGLVCIH